MTTHTVYRFAKIALLSVLTWHTLASHAVEPEQLYPALTDEVLPELAATGKYPVGVTTLYLSNPKQPDPATLALTERPLTVELWYPAKQSATASFTHYSNVTRSGKSFTLQAAAMRDVALDNSAKYPVVILSHGYTGYRTIMYYLGEHLASHGYIVASIDHTDSTNAEVDFNNAPFSGFFSTLFNRSRDQQFVLQYLNSQAHFASSSINPHSSAVIGYSMGGYGAINTVGGCYAFNAKTTAQFTGLTDPKAIAQMQQRLNSCAGGQYSQAQVDPSIKAMVALAPWGGQHQIFNTSELQKITVPSLYIAGSLDDISDYQGITRLYQNTGSKSKYLLTYNNARHNIAPHPAPAIAKRSGELDLGHYYEPSWSVRTLNEINKHFILAMMDCHVKGKREQCQYLNLPASGDQLAIDGQATAPWYGFDNRFSSGMRWQQNTH